MTEKESKGPEETPDPKAFERMMELTRRLIAVPKSELRVKRKPKKNPKPSG
jgi:hypothetical protein